MEFRPPLSFPALSVWTATKAKRLARDALEQFNELIQTMGKASAKVSDDIQIAILHIITSLYWSACEIDTVRDQ